MNNSLGASKVIRRPALAGAWYEGAEKNLRGQVSELLDSCPHRVAGDLLALIEPHAGYAYSGRSAAAGYRLVKGRKIDRVLLLAPSHYSAFHGFSIPDATHFKTPLGLCELELPVLDILRRSRFHQRRPEAHGPEHSIEIHLPFLQFCLPGAKLVPVLVGDLHGEEYQELATELDQCAVDDGTLVVVSSDFTHQGPRFDYRPFTQRVQEKLQDLDHGAARHIQNLDAQGFLDYQRKTGITVCGFRPIALLLQMLPADTQVRIISYTTSGDITGDWLNTVSYMTILFQKPDPHPPFQLPVLQPSEQAMALKIAREAVIRRVNGEDPPHPPVDLPPALLERASCFVTIQKNQRLRGCIGQLEASGRLVHSIVENAVSAACRDPRFKPIQPEELSDIQFEISVMTPPVTVSGPAEIELGRHGIILSSHGRRAVFLPQVPVDQVWTLEETFEHLCAKARLPADAWTRDTRFQVFECQVFSEADPRIQDGG